MGVSLIRRAARRRAEGLAPPWQPDTPTLIIGAQAAITSTATGLDDHQDARTKNISTDLYGLTVAGFALWLAYGVMLEQWPLIATNSICLVLAAFVLVMKILLASGKRAVADALDPSADGS